ncbi:MAG: DUF86 domain-containing protein [Acidobacteria bacterium]|nr:DUF86 domain-containing protein [Acidobacteriota bacterium]
MAARASQGSSTSTPPPRSWSFWRGDSAGARAGGSQRRRLPVRLGRPRAARRTQSLHRARTIPLWSGSTRRCRNIAVHDYQRLDIAVVRSIVHERLGDLEAFARLLVQHADSGSGST